MEVRGPLFAKLNIDAVKHLTQATANVSQLAVLYFCLWVSAVPLSNVAFYKVIHTGCKLYIGQTNDCI